MYALRNKVQLIGCIGKKPGIKVTEKGKKWVRFCIATNETYCNAQGERITETQWHTVIAWGRLAELAAKYLQKGRDTVIEGKLLSRSYTDKEGIKRQVTEIMATGMLLLKSSSS
ncbi:single-stranded DNA-binding protein [Paraflavitalea speifideaquila]|uniref:single-stranded DNA-binding protein n=1 Tax=Paraflavitalea speifideaquila TaxID=3076558 RepID=UPI0028EFA866|nr:single-stranded DNA-binding protein [Paraflavitalea speifideiaquila]